MASYTGSCVLRMRSKRDAQELLRRDHGIFGVQVVVEPYKGYAYHEKELAKGIYKVQVSDMMDKGDDVVNYRDVEKVFHRFGCTDIQLRKSGGKLSYVAVRFKTKEGRAAAIKRVDDLKLGWKIRIKKGKKEKAEEMEGKLYSHGLF